MKQEVTEDPAAAAAAAKDSSLDTAGALHTRLELAPFTKKLQKKSTNPAH